VVSGGAKTLGLMQTGRTKAVVNLHEIMTGDFTRDTDFKLPSGDLKLSLEARLKDGLVMFDASALSQAVMGDSIYSNMMIFGAAWQCGALPLAHDAIMAAITLNGAAVERNKRAFELGRWAVVEPEEAAKIAGGHDDRFTSDAMKEAVALGYHKLLSYKDEYEVARLLKQSEKRAQAAFSGDLKLTYHLAPPMVSKTGADGRPKKKAYGGRMARLFPLLARMKRLRGTPFDPFGRTAERKMERALIKQYEADMQMLLRDFGGEESSAAVGLARLPLEIRGFGPVKDAAVRKAAKKSAWIFLQRRSMTWENESGKGLSYGGRHF